MIDLGLMGFGPRGWGLALLQGAGMTVMLALVGFAIGAAIGILAAWAKISGGRSLRAVAGVYTTVLRGIPDLLVIYLFYFGGSMALTQMAGWFGHQGFLDLPGFVAGALALGVVSGALQAEVFRAAWRGVHRGEVEAALAFGMGRLLCFRRIALPLAARHALPGMGNVWQVLLKESALVSVTGVVELLRRAQMGAGSTRQPFDFFFAAAMLYLVITSASGLVFGRAETRFSRGLRR
ncbi:MAG TPA: ABC transporter permease subunit [Acidisoma sp.]|jgi:octopine/nopaline transport system permease protein|nr:ABC transporter permease subunit [Acidisoma sp.]